MTERNEDMEGETGETARKNCRKREMLVRMRERTKKESVRKNDTERKKDMLVRMRERRKKER